MKKQVIFLWFILLLTANCVLAAGMSIKKIGFRGVHFKGDEDLKNIIQSQEGDRFDVRLIKLDKILLSNYYKSNGFLDVAVDHSVLYTEGRKFVHLIYTLREGQRYYYGGVRFRGNKEINAAALAEEFNNIKLYSPFDENQITVAVQNVEKTYYNSGKPFVQINVDYLFEQDSLIVVLLNIKENQTVYIKNISYTGLKKVKQFILRRELEFKAGEIYNRQKLEASQKNLYGTGLFKYVRFEIEPISGQPDQVKLHIWVQEKDSRWLGVRFGVAHEQEAYYGNKFEFTLQGGHRNLFGTARSISLHVTPSLIYDVSERRFHNPDNRIALRFVEPWILATRTPGILNLTYEQFRPLNSGSFDLWRAKFDLHRKIGKSTEISASLDTKFIKLVSGQSIDSTLALAAQTDKSTVYSLIFYWKRDKRKNIFNPQNSSYTDVSLSYSYSQGRDAQNNLLTNNYISLFSSWQRYQPFRPKVLHYKRWHFTLASRLKAGAIIEPGQKKIIPINDRLYAGGATTVRGYPEQLLGPAAKKDANGKIIEAAGGKLMFISNIEVRMPLVWVFVGEVFTDAGYVWPEISDFRATDIKVTSGLGLVALTPLGPVRLDYGHKWMPSAQDASNYAWHIGIYFAF